MIHEHIAGFWSLEHVHLEHANICSRTSVFTELLHANIPNMRTCFEHALEHANICSHEHILRTCRIAVFYDTKLFRWRSFESRLGSTLQHTSAHPNTPVETMEEEKTSSLQNLPANMARTWCKHASNMLSSLMATHLLKLVDPEHWTQAQGYISRWTADTCFIKLNWKNLAYCWARWTTDTRFSRLDPWKLKKNSRSRFLWCDSYRIQPLWLSKTKEKQ